MTVYNIHVSTGYALCCNVLQVIKLCNTFPQIVPKCYVLVMYIMQNGASYQAVSKQNKVSVIKSLSNMNHLVFSDDGQDELRSRSGRHVSWTSTFPGQI